IGQHCVRRGADRRADVAEGDELLLLFIIDGGRRGRGFNEWLDALAQRGVRAAVLEQYVVRLAWVHSEIVELRIGGVDVMLQIGSGSTASGAVLTVEPT